MSGETVIITPKGSPGRGVPRLGNTGQVLAKLSGEDFDTGWVDQTGGGGGGPGVDFLTVALSDETTPLVAVNPSIVDRFPFPATLVSVRAGLTTASSSGPVTVDITQDGVSIFTTPLTIDEGDTTSVGATVPPVLASSALEDDGRIGYGIITPGAGATGLKVTLLYQKT
jgi:hypothetical protein